MNHTFTTSSPQIIIPITTPFNISFTLTPPRDFRPTPGVATRLLHVRTHEGQVRETEIFELKVSGHNQLVCERSGIANRKREGYIEPSKFDLPSNGQYNVTYNSGVLTVNNSIPLSTHLAIANGVTVELCFGFDKSNDELVAPFGWVLETNLGTGTITPSQPPQPPITTPVTTQPPVTVPPVTTPPTINPPVPTVPIPTPPIVTTPTSPIVPIIPPVINPTPNPTPTNPTITPEDQLKKELIQDLTNLVTKYALRQGVDPQVFLFIQLALTFVNKK